MNHPTPHRLSGQRARDGARILWALFTKDVLDVLKNKNTIVVILTSLLMVFFYRALPAMSTQGEPVNLFVYDPAHSALIPLLENSQNIELHTYPSEEKMKQSLADGEVPELGLVIPVGFDRAFQAGETPELQGYVLRWVNEDDAARLQHIAETEIANLLGRPVPVRLAGRVDLLPDSDGLGLPAGFGLVFVTIMIGVILVPHLMLEEKQNRTLEVLAVSPASAGQIVTAKALAGLFYCSLGGIIALLVNRVLVVHWGLAILTVLLGSLFAVSLSLWLGIKVDSRAQLSMWSWVILLPLILPMIFSLELPGLSTSIWAQMIRIVPTAAILNLIRTSFANPIPLRDTLLQLAWVAAATGAVLAVVAWTLRRRDREAGAFSSLWQPAAANLSANRPNSLAHLLAGIARLQVGKALIPAEAGKPASGSLVQAVENVASPASTARKTDLRQPRTPGPLQLIRAIAAKDLLEALKNRLILSILLGTSFILLSSAALLLLLADRSLPRLVVFDQGRSTILRGLAAREDFRLVIVDSQAEMERALSGSPVLQVGLVLPADFDQRAGSGQALRLPVYYPHWADPDKLSQRAALFEQQLSQASWAVVRLDQDGHAVYPLADSGGQPWLLSLNLVAVILVVGIALVPLLMIEEKEAQTLKVLLVSPANLNQVIAGKALVGLFYSLLPALVGLLIYRYLFVHWGLAVLAILLAAGLGVAIGLLVGLLSDTPTTASMWGSLLLLLLLGSAFLKLFGGLNLPAAVQAALDWLPGAAMLQLINLSQAGEVPTRLLWLNVGALLAAIAAVSLLLAWHVRRAEG